jgi:hypothetical protein
MKKTLCTSFIAFSTFAAALAEEAPSIKEGHSYLVKDGKLVDTAELATTSPTSTPAPAPASPSQIVINNNVTQVSPVPQVSAPAPVVVAPVIVAAPTPQPTYVFETGPSFTSPITLMKWAIETVNNHDWQAIAPYIVDGHLNYFGTRHATLSQMRREMESDARHYGHWTANWDVNTFSRHSSNEYSPYWVGPMQYDELTAYVQVDEPGVRVHRALERLTIGYTYVNGDLKIYALTMRVL